MNLKKFALLVAAGGFVTLGGMTFADEMHIHGQGDSKFGSGQAMSGDMKGSRGEHNETSMLSGFIDYTSLTDDEKLALQSLIDTHKLDMQAIKSQFTGSLTDEQKSTLQEQMKSLRTIFCESVKAYVSSDKLDQFNEMMTKMNEMKDDMGGGNFGSGHMVKDANYASGKNLEDGRKYKNNMTAQTTEFKYIKGDTYNSIKSKLEAMDTDQLNTLLSKVEAAITNVQNSNIAKKDLYIEVYAELKTIITQILGDSSTQESTDLLNEILQAE